LGFPIEKIATHIGIKAVELDIVPERSPISVAGAAIFMAAHASDKQFARNELSNATGVANVTIRTVYKLMRPRAAELFPDSFNLDLTKLPRV
jgi:transcription initiation factor TFIIB